MSLSCLQFSQKTNENNLTWGTIVAKYSRYLSKGFYQFYEDFQDFSFKQKLDINLLDILKKTRKNTVVHVNM